MCPASLVESFDERSRHRSDLTVREGLPPGFRMRADAHYVDQLDTRMSSIPVRLIDTQAIEAGHQSTRLRHAGVRRFGTSGSASCSPPRQLRTAAVTA